MIQRSICTIAIVALGVISGIQPATAEGPTSRPAARGELMNASCPIEPEKKANAKHFVEYADAQAGVHARIHVCCGKCRGKLSGGGEQGLRTAYEQAYLMREDGSQAAYGKAALEVGNTRCPYTGNPVNGSTTLNYNGALINLCCPGCDEGILKDPDKYLHNINDAIDAALEAAKGETQAGD